MLQGDRLRFRAVPEAPRSFASGARRGLVLAAAGAAALLGAQLIPADASVSRQGPDRPVNAGGSDPGDISAHNSPTVARNPRSAGNLVVTSRVDSPDFTCAVHVSFDGGAAWRPTRVPTPKGEGPKCYAPDASFGPDGTLHVSWVTLRGRGNVPNAVWVASSPDGGKTLGSPRKVAGRLAFQVRITADRTDRRRLYATWVQAREVGALKFTGPGNPVLMARSDDGGTTWERPVQVNAPKRGRVLAPSTVVGPKGELYVVFLDVGDDRLDYEGGHDARGGPAYPGRFALIVARSTDRGATWTESIVDDAVVPTRRFVAFLPPAPSLAVDVRSGRVYVGFEDGRQGDPDAWIWSLAPGAATWSKARRVNDTPARDGTAQYLPKLAVAPNGRLDVVYYDRRDDGRRNVFNAVSLQSSDDGGETFGPRVALSSRSFDSRIGAGSERDLADLGSRLGLVSGDESAFAAWSDTRAGTDASNKQDIAGARILVEASSAAKTLVAALRVAGIALLLGGLLLAFVALPRGPRRTAA